MDDLLELVIEQDNRPVTTSRKVAEAFEKEHYNVIRDIENLDCSEKFNALNFELVNYKDKKGENRPEYIMTKDGFTFLAMGYTGKKAAQFKEAYIDAFNKMEQMLRSKQNLKVNSKDKSLEVVDRLYKFAALDIPERCKELCTLEAVKLLIGAKPKVEIEIKSPKLFIELVEQDIRINPGAEYSTESIAREYGMRAYDLNRRLALMDIQSRQGDRWILSPEYRFRSYRVYGNSRFWTPVGVRFIYNTLKSQGVLPLDERITSII